MWLSDELLQLILDENITEELYALINQDSLPIGYTLMDGNLAVGTVVGLKYKQAQILAYINQLLFNMVNVPGFWERIAVEIARAPYQTPPLVEERVEQHVYPSSTLANGIIIPGNRSDTVIRETYTLVRRPLRIYDINLKRVVDTRRPQSISSLTNRQVRVGSLAVREEAVVVRVRDQLIKTQEEANRLSRRVGRQLQPGDLVSYMTARYSNQRANELIDRYNGRISQREYRLLLRPDFLRRSFSGVLYQLEQEIYLPLYQFGVPQ